MSTDLRFTAEVNQKVIVALSGLTEERLTRVVAGIEEAERFGRLVMPLFQNRA